MSQVEKYTLVVMSPVGYAALIEMIRVTRNRDPLCKLEPLDALMGIPVEVDPNALQPHQLLTESQEAAYRARKRPIPPLLG